VFGSIGGTELLLILVIALLIFGPRKLPELGRSLGRGLAEFRKAGTEFKTTLEKEIASEDGMNVLGEVETAAREVTDAVQGAAALEAPAPPTVDKPKTG
jgi:TatA/E family protein of Tat protein translocase